MGCMRDTGVGIGIIIGILGRRTRVRGKEMFLGFLLVGII